MIKIPGRDHHAESLSEQYDQEFFAQHRALLPAYTALAQLIHDDIRPTLPGKEHHENKRPRSQRTDTSILDVGCGHGLLVECLRQAGFSAYGAEGSSSAMALWPDAHRQFYQLTDLRQAAEREQLPKTDYICSASHPVGRLRLRAIPS